MLLSAPLSQGFESGDVLEDRQHPLGEIRAGKLVARFVTNNLYQLVDLVTFEAVHIRCSLLLHAATVRNCSRRRQRRLQ